MTACGAPPEGMENTVLISPLPYVPIPSTQRPVTEPFCSLDPRLLWQAWQQF